MNIVNDIDFKTKLLKNECRDIKMGISLRDN